MVNGGNLARDKQVGGLYLLGWCIFGLVVGAITRLLMPGEERLGCIGTMLLGIAGALVGGLLVTLLSGGIFRGSGFIGALIGSIIVLWAYRQFSQRQV